MNGLKLRVTVTKTANGEGDYIQIISQDAFSVNSVFVADEIKVEDKRRDNSK